MITETKTTVRRSVLASVRLAVCVVVVLAATTAMAPAASAAFGISDWDGLTTLEANDDALDHGSVFTQAGGHPYQITTNIDFNGHPAKSLPRYPDAAIKDIFVDLPPGLVGNPTAIGTCTTPQLATQLEEPRSGLLVNTCPINSMVGMIYINDGGIHLPLPLYNMVAPTGVPARFSFIFLGVIVSLDSVVRGEGAGFHLGIDAKNISQSIPFVGSKVVFWGTPSDPSHDGDRCKARTSIEPPLCPGAVGEADGPNAAGLPPVPFITLPTSCTPPGTGLRFDVSSDSWDNPGVFDQASYVTHEAPPNELNQRGTERCEAVPSSPVLTAQPTQQSAESPTGLNVSLRVPSDGLLNAEGTAQADLKSVTVRLPEGISTNPSVAEGLGACTLSQYESETLSSAPGTGCPSTSKIGTVSLETPLLERSLAGGLFIAKQRDNPFGSLLALYMVIKDPQLGIVLKQAGEVRPDRATGQLTTTFDNLPQVPFSNFTLSFREGARSPLVTPPGCGTYTTDAEFVPWSAADTDHPAPAEIVHSSSIFQINTGVGGGACPSAATPPFHPGLEAGAINNAAGHFSPFNVRLTRNDGEQEFTHFSIKLPPGISGKLAGVPYCSDAALEAAKQKTGTAELASPSCPTASEVGRTLVGAGVGSVLTYAPGKLYLAGPYHGAPISIAAITAAKVGPFDLGTVVVRQALKIDPETAEVFIDATGSDPIPHIIDGIPVHARDIRVYVDKPQFVLNPTDCDRTSTASTVLGSGLNFASEADDNPITVTSPFQAADCAALPFKPKLSLRLLGGTKRGAHPAFRANLKMHGIGEAAIESAQVTLPHSEFLENSHIKTICTRVQFNQGAFPGQNCPAGSVYGYAKAITPILAEPLTGPVFLRSSEHQLPDLVAALHSPTGINVNLIGRIDSVKGGGIRNTFESVPDAPVSEFTLTMQGGKKGLLVNSTNLCKGTHKAEVNFDAHNGKASDTKPALKTKCPKAKKHKRPQG